jgi:uncharacterized integral membrane protein
MVRAKESDAMQLIIGRLLVVVAAIAFRLSLPKNRQPRWFANTAWESPIVIAMLLAFGMGVLFSIVGAVA